MPDWPDMGRSIEIIMQCNTETKCGVIPKICPQTYSTLRSCYCIYVHVFFLKRNKRMFQRFF